MSFDDTNPATFDPTLSATIHANDKINDPCQRYAISPAKIRDRSISHSPATATASDVHYTMHSTAHSMALSDSKESLFIWRGRRHGGTPGTPLTRAAPKSRYSSLSRETSYLAPITLSILGCNHPLFLC